MKSRLIATMLIVATLLLIGACTAEPRDISECLETASAPAGFWLGLWHGFIAPVTFVLSLFLDNITVYEVNNNGGWYIFGFLLGIGAFTKGGSEGAKRARR